jgi:hypothetical protein
MLCIAATTADVPVVEVLSDGSVFGMTTQNLLPSVGSEERFTDLNIDAGLRFGGDQRGSKTCSSPL